MVQIQSKDITLADFLALPERKPTLEYVDGQIFEKVMPKGKHSGSSGFTVKTV